MALEAKVSLLNQLEKTLSPVLSAANMPSVMGTLSDVLAEYNVEQNPTTQCADDCLEAFISAKQIEGRSEKTLERYNYILGKMIAFVKVPTRNITVFHLRSYMAEEKKRGIADVTLEGTRSVFSSYFGWLHKEGLISQNPCANFSPIKCQKKVKVAYTAVELEELKCACGNLRDKAIMCFLLSTGCRISEVTRLNISDVSLEKRECVVLGKGNKQRTVYLDDVTAALLRLYWATERNDKSPALFTGRGTSRITPGGIRAMLKRLQRDAHLESVVHPHKFRRTLATTLIHHGMPIQEVAAILGHDKLDTTMKYVCLDKTAIKYSYNKYR